MKSVKATVGHKRRNELNKLHNQIRFHLQAYKEAELYTNNLDFLDAEFHTKLLNKYPSLTKSEQQLFSLIKIKLNPHQIAQIKNVEPSSIKTLRYRLKQKLELKTADDLDKFIHQF
jgi:DNA-binding CsgD family transcriptional regulator